MIAVERVMAVSMRWPDEMRRALEEEDTAAIQALFVWYANEEEKGNE